MGMGFNNYGANKKRRRWGVSGFILLFGENYFIAVLYFVLIAKTGIHFHYILRGLEGWQAFLPKAG